MARFLAKAQDSMTNFMYGKEVGTVKNLFYDLVDKDMKGNDVKMSTFEGSVLCGLTKQNYTELVKLVDDYGARGFKVLAFPCNQFGKQEPGTHDDILAFSEKFNARDKFTFFEKADVNGKKAREVFSFLKQKLPHEDGSKDIRWNFGKFLIDHEGNPHKRFGSTVAPMKMKEEIEILLKKKEEGAAASKE